MSVGLQIKNECHTISGGYEGEAHDITDHTYQNWTTVGDTGSATNGYYFSDSDSSDNNNSSRVYVNIADSWEVIRVNPDNSIYIKITTMVTGITRADVVGNPATSVYYRNMWAKKTASSPTLWSITNDYIGDAHTISTGFTVGEEYVTIAPQTEWSRGTLYFRSNTPGHDSDTPPSKYIDEFWMGANFRNTLPDRYHPGALIDNGQWMSHDRSNGNTKILSDTGWTEMWTINGGTATGDPPYIRHTDGDKNMRRIGNG